MMNNEEVRSQLKVQFDKRREGELSPEELEKVNGGSWYNAPDAPECPYCHSHDTLTVGFFLMWNGFCRKCGSYFDDTTKIRK